MKFCNFMIAGQIEATNSCERVLGRTEFCEKRVCSDGNRVSPHARLLPTKRHSGRSFTVMRVSAALFIVIWTVMAVAAAPELRAQTLAYDAASVKVQDTDSPKSFQMSGGPGSSDPGRFRAKLNMSSLLSAAFGLGVDQIKGPAWLRDFAAMPYYELVATMPPDTTKAQSELMLQNLLSERFHLIFHYDIMSAASYSLVADKGGIKLKEATPEAETAAATSATTTADGFPVLPGTRMLGWRSGTTRQRIKYQEWPMSTFVGSLGFLIGKALGKSLDDGFLQPHVVNKTGLTGKYTFILEYDCAACAPLNAKPADVASDAVAYPGIFVALQKQLGLRLEKTADVAVRVVVVDSVDKVPTAN
jgi:uncharacterized protein (TIGR03435 family)